MARPLRIAYENAWYHVMNRGRQRQKIYRCEEDYRHFLDILQETVKIFDLRIAAFCLMSNHYHLLLMTPRANLSRCMRHINSLYTQYYNRKYGKEGQLFRGRFKSILVAADSYLLEVMRYIHRNPVRAAIVENVAAYQWSSHAGYLSNASRWKWIFKQPLLSMLDSNPSRQAGAYRQFVDQPDSEQVQKIFNAKKLPAVLGSDTFVTFIKEKYYALKKNPEIPQSRSLVPDISHIQKAVCAEFMTDPAELARSRRGVTNDARNVVIYLARKHAGLKLDDIGRLYTIASYSSVSSILVRMRERLRKDRQLQKRVQNIETKLRMSQEQI